MENKVNTISSVLKFADTLKEYLHIAKAFLKGYEAFMAELKNTSGDE